MNFTELKSKTIFDLINLGKSMGLNLSTHMSRHDIIYLIFKCHIKNGNDIFVDGVLEVLRDGFGFLRSVSSSYLSSFDDIYVSPSQIKLFNLRTGDTILGKIRMPKNNEVYYSLLRIEKINYELPVNMRNKIFFENLTPLHANLHLRMEFDDSCKDLTPRILDLLSPIGRGQRGLIVAPPKAGKTMLLQSIGRSISYNYPDCFLIILLIDERPEEVTEMKRSIKGEVIASTFDENPSRHIKIAEMVIEKSKRLVENKKDVVILLDSITRLARAYNNVIPTSGKILTGGIDSNALNRPKRFFGSARNLEEGGSLTIIATALVDTGSRMDEVIYEEFKGTGNMELNLSRKIAEKRIFPAINCIKSGTRKEEFLISHEDLNKIWVLRKFISSMNEVEAMEFMLSKLLMTKNNADFFNLMKYSKFNLNN